MIPIFPDYTFIEDIVHEGYNQIRVYFKFETQVRVLRDGVYYLVLVRDTMSTTNHVNQTKSETMQRFIRSVYMTQQLIKVDPNIILAEGELPLFHPDKTQESEQERLFKKYPYLKP